MSPKKEEIKGPHAGGRGLQTHTYVLYWRQRYRHGWGGGPFYTEYRGEGFPKGGTERERGKKGFHIFGESASMPPFISFTFIIPFTGRPPHGNDARLKGFFFFLLSCRHGNVQWFPHLKKDISREETKISAPSVPCDQVCLARSLIEPPSRGFKKCFSM